MKLLNTFPYANFCPCRDICSCILPRMIPYHTLKPLFKLCITDTSGDTVCSADCNLSTVIE